MEKDSEILSLEATVKEISAYGPFSTSTRSVTCSLVALNIPFALHSIALTMLSELKVIVAFSLPLQQDAGHEGFRPFVVKTTWTSSSFVGSLVVEISNSTYPTYLPLLRFPLFVTDGVAAVNIEAGTGATKRQRATDAVKGPEFINQDNVGNCRG